MKDGQNILQLAIQVMLQRTYKDCTVLLLRYESLR